MIRMLQKVSDIVGLDINAPNGIFVGRADKISVDPDSRSCTGIIISRPSPVIADKGVIVKIPYRWVQAIGDIIILKTFPEHINYDGTIDEQEII